MTCDPNTISRAASCLRCLTDGQLMQIKTYLMCRWVAAAGGVAPGSPTGIDINGPLSSQTNVVVIWNNPSPNGTTNEIWKSTDGINFVLFATVAGNVSQKVDTTGMPANSIWYWKVRSCNGSSCSAFTSPVSVSFNYVSPNVAAISFPTLVIAFGSFQADGLAALASVSLPVLRQVFLNLDLANNPNLTTVSLTSLATVGNALFLGSDNITGALSLPALTLIGADLQIQGNLLMTSVSAPNLTSVGGNFVAQSQSGLTSITLTLLHDVGVIQTSGRLYFDACTALTTINLPALVQVWGDGTDELTTQGSTLLSTWNAPNWLPNDFGNTIDFQACALNVASVNQILARGVAAGVTIDDFELAGGTNAAPAGQGIVDKATLIGLGNTVNTN